MPKRYHEVIPGFWICDAKTRHNKNFLTLHQFDKIVHIDTIQIDSSASLQLFLKKIYKCLLNLQCILLWSRQLQRCLPIIKLFYQEYAHLTSQGVNRMSKTQALEMSFSPNSHINIGDSSYIQ